MSQDDVEVIEEIEDADEIVRVLYAVLQSVGSPVTINPVDIEEGHVIMVDPQADGTVVVHLVKGDGNN